MNPLVKARQDALDAAIAAAQALDATASDEQMNDAKAKIDEARASLDSAKSLGATLTESEAHLNSRAGVRSVGAVPAMTSETRDNLIQLGYDPEQLGAQIRTGQNTSYKERVGTEVYGRTPGGDWVPTTSEGWGLSEKQFHAISEPAYEKAFDRMLRGKADRADYNSTLNEGNDGQGGFLAPPQFQTEVIMRKPHPTSIMNYIRQLPCSRDRVIFPRVNYTTDDIYSTGVRIQWVGEGGPTPAITDPAFGDVEIPIFLGQFPLEVSRNLLEDGAVPVGPLISSFAAQAYNLGMDNIIVNGTGVGQPAGILQNPGGANEPPTVNVGNPVTADGLTTLVYGLPPQYQDGAVGLMNFVDAFMTFAKIKDSASHYVFGLQSTFDGGLATARRPELFGKPVVFSAFMPNGGAGAKVVAYGDLRETYLLAQRVGLSVMPYGDQDKSMLTANKVGWLFRFRSGGDVVQPRGLRVGAQT